MFTFAASEARKSFSTAIRTAQHGDVFIDRRGEFEVVVISVAKFNRFMGAAEEADDVAAFDAAIVEEGPDIP